MKKLESDSTSMSSIISTSEIQAIIEQLQSEQHRGSTRKSYLAVWKIFNEFFVRLDRKPIAWADRITLFVGYLVNSNKKSSTVRSYISAIKAALSYIGVEVNENKVLIGALTKACKLKNDKIQVKILIRKSFLHTLVKKVDELFISPQPHLSILYKAMLTTMYYGLFRVGEVTLSDHVVKACDVKIGDNKNKMLFILRSLKMHNVGMKPQLIKIKRQKLKSNSNKPKDILAFCPFQALLNYTGIRKKRKSNTEPFFVFKDRTPVTANNFRNILNKLIMKCGLDPVFYGTVGFRAGCTTDLLDMGVSVETIRKLGRWKSNAVYTYLRS